MNREEAFGPDVTPEEFFLERLPDLHRDELDRFEQFCETTLRFCIGFEDIEERYSVELRPDGARAREGEFIEFPVVTIEGSSETWGTAKQYTAKAFERGEEALDRDAPTDRIDEDFLRDLERHDGVIEVAVEAPDRDEPVTLRLVLNDYEAPPNARSVRATVDADLLESVLEGDRSPTDAVNAVELAGDMSLAFDLSGLLLEHFPELEE